MCTLEIKPTLVEAPSHLDSIQAGGKVTLLGSCFASEIGKYLSDAGMNILNNPFGVLYNPASIAHSIKRLLNGNSFCVSDIVPRDINPSKVSSPSGTISSEHRQIAPEGGGWVSFFHHGSFARETPEDFLANANSCLARSAKHFADSSHIIITFGTAGVFRHIERDMIVSNCHKHPAREFRRESLSIEDIVNLWAPLLQQLSDKQFIFTVSPIRYRVDGMHGNAVSKATLLLAVEQLCRNFANATYFPAYEIVLDELRDYRWFAADGVHPSPEAVRIVCNRFLGL